MSYTEDTRKTCIQANHISAKHGHFNNINVKLKSLEGKVANISANIADQDQLKVVTGTTSSRALTAFAVGSQVAGEKFRSVPPYTASGFDRRVVTLDGVEYCPWLFAKTLKHDDNGFCRKEDLDRLLRVCTPSETSVEQLTELQASIDPETIRKLEGLCTGSSFWIKGIDTQVLSLPEANRVDSVAHVADMMEVYEMSLLRDTSFADIQQEGGPSVERALRVMNNYRRLGAFSGPVNFHTGTITGKELFRGIGRDETVGPYVSQFLLLPYELNGIPTQQRYPLEGDVPETVDFSYFVQMQRGRVHGSPNRTGEMRFLATGRGLGSYAHNDPMYFAYLIAMYIATQRGFAMQHQGDDVSSAWTDQGSPDALSSLADVALGSLRVAWFSKFNKFLQIRPEVMGARIEAILTDILQGEVTDRIRQHLEPGQDTLDAVRAKNGNSTYFLMGMYPEGSPTHPSLPAGHAVLAGAAITILKAFLKTHQPDGAPLPWPETPIHSVDGLHTSEYLESDKSNMTITGELNKLGSNIAMGRNFGAVHYRADGDKGIQLGEDFAIKYLQCKLKEYSSTYRGLSSFTLETVKGDLIRIAPDNVTKITSRGVE